MTISSPAAVGARRSSASAQAWLLAPCLLTLWTLALHLPGRGTVGPDDGFFIEAAHLWLTGAPPYLHVFDVKPPGFFALLALAEAVFGPSQATLEALTVVCEATTAYCLFRLGRQIGSAEAGLFAAIGYPVLSQMLANNPPYPPLAMATTAGFMFATGRLGWRSRVVLSGLAIGLAATIKQTAVVEGAALLWLLLRDPEADGRRRVCALIFASAACVAPLALAALLAAQGALSPMLADIVVSAAQRTGMDSDSAADVLRRFVSVQMKLLPLIAVALGALAWTRSSARPGDASRSAALLPWLAASWLELLLQHGRWTNYLGPTFAPLLLIAGAVVVAAFRDAILRRAALAFLLLAQIYTAYPLRSWIFRAPDDRETISTAAQMIANRQPAAQDRLLAILLGEQLNYVSGLAPPTAYMHWEHLFCDFPGAGPERLREALDARPRFIVAPVNPPRPPCENRRAWPLVESALANGYRPLGEAPASSPNLRIYERIDRE